MSRYIFHIDVNSAYLSWTAAYRLQQGSELDLREIPSVVGGDEKSRHGIVLAKSIPAKRYGIHTGEPLVAARRKCPNLTIVPPNYGLFMKASYAMLEIIRSYSPKVQQFSIDECFMDYIRESEDAPDPLTLAYRIKNQIHEELGFTVNIGVSVNKILAKMASDFAKPNKVHTLFPEEVKEKLWPLPVTELFMVGRQTSRKLSNLGIVTIGQLAIADTDMLYREFKSFAYLIQSYANGVDDSPIRASNHEVVKGMGNSTTVKFDVTQRKDAYQVLLSLCESVGMRLRRARMCAGLITVSVVDTEFGYKTHQRKLDVAMDSTAYIFEVVKSLFDELWNEGSIRKLGVRVSDLHTNDYIQLSLFENYDFERDKSLNKAIDQIRGKYGLHAVQRASFLHSGMKPITGGVSDDEGDYPVMTSIL